jgi:hypothetical protein
VITAKAMQQCLMFIYTGTIEQEYLQLEVIELINFYESGRKKNRRFFTFPIKLITLFISFAPLSAQIEKYFISLISRDNCFHLSQKAAAVTKTK